jgi:hypothetical protein
LRSHGRAHETQNLNNKVKIAPNGIHWGVQKACMQERQ